MKIRNTLASKKDKKCTILSSEMKIMAHDLPENVKLFVSLESKFIRNPSFNKLL